jgi:SSS family solute:Na+ symporter
MGGMLGGLVAVYLLGMLAIGWWAARRRIGGVTDFLLAGRRVGPWLGAATLAATHLGGGALLGGAEQGFRIGLAGAWYGLASGAGLLLLALLTARTLRQLALHTLPEYLALRYGSRALQRLAALLSLVALIGITAAQVIAAGAALSRLGLDPLTARLLAAAVFVGYTVAGGLWAAVVTDLVQVLVAAAGAVLVAGAVLWALPAGSGLAAAAAERAGTAPEGYGSLFGAGGAAAILWVLLPTVQYTLIGQDFYQRLFATRSATAARTAALLGGLVLVAVSFAPVVAGMGARALGPADLPAAEALPWALDHLLPPLAGSLVLAALLAATMSTADSLLTAATSHALRDLRAAPAAPNERAELRRARIGTLLLGSLAGGLALTSSGIIDTLIVSYTLYCGGVFVPVLGGLLWPAARRAGALAALGCGGATALGGLVLFEAPDGVALLVATIVATAALVIGSLAAGRWGAGDGLSERST